MVLNASAVLAILQLEPEAAHHVQISAVSVLEAGMVIERRRGAEGGRDLDALLRDGAVDITPFDAEQATPARQAFQRFGNGRHATALNFGDCAAYALAMAVGEPLLSKGNDFSRTDVVSVRKLKV